MYREATTKPPEDVLWLALRQGSRSKCQKSKRGAVAFWQVQRPEFREYEPVYVFCNEPELPEGCTGTEWCRAHCSKICSHAEENLARKDIRGADVVHVKVQEGMVLKTSGPPSCASCARALLKAGAVAVWLFHEEGWRRYEINDFFRQSVENSK